MEQEQDSTNKTTYWDVQVRAIGALKAIGIYHQLEDRLEPMKILRKIMKLGRNPNLIAPRIQELRNAFEAVTNVVAWRVHGYEPPSKGGKYVKGG